MNLEEFKTSKHQLVLASMINFMKYEDEDEDGDDFDCGYTQEEIDKCANILDVYIDELLICNRDEKKIMASVEKTILALNALNNECEGSLIETDQRESLCKYIEDAAVVAGLPQPKDDITEEWREW